MSAKRKFFDDWTTQQIRDTFGLHEASVSSILEHWLAAIALIKRVFKQYDFKILVYPPKNVKMDLWITN